MPGFVLDREAEVDLTEIVDHLCDDAGAAVALEVLDAIESAFHYLAEHPQIGHFRPDLTSRDVRFWNIYRYVIVYEPASRPLRVYRVLHGSRNIGDMIE